MTIPEYELLMEAVNLKEVDKDYRNHLQAFLNFSVKATKGKGGKPVYKDFKKFFNYEEALEKVKKRSDKKSRFPGIGELLKKGV